MTSTTPSPSSRMQNAVRRVQEARVTETCGRVVQLIGLVVESEGPLASLAVRSKAGSLMAWEVRWTDSARSFQIITSV